MHWHFWEDERGWVVSEGLHLTRLPNIKKKPAISRCRSGHGGVVGDGYMKDLAEFRGGGRWAGGLIEQRE